MVTGCLYLLGATSTEEGNENANQEDSEDDDVHWYKEEVGEDPDEGTYIDVVKIPPTSPPPPPPPLGTRLVVMLCEIYFLRKRGFY